MLLKALFQHLYYKATEHRVPTNLHGIDNPRRQHEEGELQGIQ